MAEENEQSKATINQGMEDELVVWGFKEHRGKLLATILAVMMTGGVLGLVLYWVKHWWLRLSQVKCSLEEATSVLIMVRNIEII